MIDGIKKMNVIKEDKNILLHYLKLKDLLYEFDNMVTFHKSRQFERGIMNDNVTYHERKGETQKKKFSMTGNELLINYKDYKESLCNICHFLMCSMSQESFMLCQECGCMYSIKFDFISAREAEVNNRESKYPYKRKNCSIEQLETFLCRIPTRVTKKDLDTIINAFTN